ncbi:MAG: hypothetical protein SNH35_00295 [Rikenellaceae bacterium]
MKKIIAIAAVAVMVMCGLGCSNDDSVTYSAKGDKYVGTLITERNADGYDDIEQENIVFYVDAASNGSSVDLYMPDVTFFYTSSYSMPKIDIVIFSIPKSDVEGVYYADYVTIKEIEDREVLENTALNAYSGISNIEVNTTTPNEVYITFDCKLEGVTRAVTYHGTGE